MTASGADQKRIRAERRGRWSEYLAALSLLLKGYRILALRYRTRGGEVDIIARRGNLVAFIEVKARNDIWAGIDAVSPHAQRRIATAAGHWLSRQSDAAKLSWRYDIIVVRPGRWPVQLKSAF